MRPVQHTSRGQSAAQKGTAADMGTNVVRRPEITMLAPARKNALVQAAHAPVSPGRLDHGGAGDV
jgi:hypothetical protein